MMKINTDKLKNKSRYIFTALFLIIFSADFGFAQTSLTAAEYFARGSEHENKQRYSEAIADYTKAIELEPTYLSAYQKRAKAYWTYFDDKNDLAIADYTKAIDYEPSAAAYSYRASAYSEQKKYDLAISDFTKSIEMNPQDAEAYASRAYIYCLSGKKILAAADEKKTIELGGKLQEKCK